MRYLFLVLFLVLTSCGTEWERQYKCTIEGNACDGLDQDDQQDEETTQVTVGQPGPRGPSGDDGSSCSVSKVDNITTMLCTDGSIAYAYDGVDGQDGTNGSDGQDGTSCSVAPASNGALITCGSESVLVLNGLDGQDGEDGEDGQDAVTSAYSIEEIIDPCGDALDIYDEIFLRLRNNTLIWSLSDKANGHNTRFAQGVPGSWTTTDGSSCHFTVHGDMSISW